MGALKPVIPYDLKMLGYYLYLISKIHYCNGAISHKTKYMTKNEINAEKRTVGIHLPSNVIQIGRDSSPALVLQMLLVYKSLARTV